MQQELDGLGGHVGKLREDLDKKDAQVFALNAAVRRRDAEILRLQGVKADAHKELLTRLELARVACFGSAATVESAAREATCKSTFAMPAGREPPVGGSRRDRSRSRSR